MGRAGEREALASRLLDHTWSPSGSSISSQHRSSGAWHRACCVGNPAPPPPSLRRADPSTQLIPAFQPGLPAQPPDVFSAPTSHRVGAGRPGTPAPAEAAGPAPRSPQAWWLWLWRMSKSRPLLLAGAQPGLPAYSGQPKSRFEVRPPEGM